ncbi:MAG TPA: DinB family protein [Euzebyales bacterium]|nr:DinB family protein [Euzebyales bacterium]
MAAPSRDLLRWQFDLAWSLFAYHLERLTPDDLHWEPAAHCWTVRPDVDGRWVPDWADTEPDPAPVPTIGWLTWHLGWWWTTALHHLQGRTPPDRAGVAWPGSADATIVWLRDLHDAWSTAVRQLADADLDATAPFPWPDGAGLTVAHMLAWVNAELMKNVAEIGQLRMLRHADAPAG